MIHFDKWVLPAGETHLQAWMIQKNRRVDGRLTYQYEKYEAAVRHCKQRRVAIDVGAHVGLWSYWMARDFVQVECFEPKSEHAQCWFENMLGHPNAHLHQFALGQCSGRVGLVTGPSSSGDTTVDPHGSDVPMLALDSFEYRSVDLLKIDCEGYEVFVLEGATELLTTSRPVVIVEQKPGHGQRFGRGEHDALRFLETLGYERKWDYAGDYVMVAPEIH